jgi:hypothetical protein
LIIRLIIQTNRLDPSGAVWSDKPSNVSRLDPSGADLIDRGPTSTEARKPLVGEPPLIQALADGVA